MADDVVLELGWGRLVFGQTFADLRRARRRAARRGARRAATSASTRATRTCWSAWRPTSCSSTRATPTGCGCTDRDEPAPASAGFSVRPLRRRRRTPTRSTASTCATGWCPRRSRCMWDNQRTRTRSTYLVADATTTGKIVGTVTGVDHARRSATRRTARACGAWPSTRRRARPAPARRWCASLAERYRARGRAYMDLSVMHDNAAAIAPVREAGLRPRARSASSGRTRSTNRCSPPPPEPRRAEPVRADHRRRGDAARHLGRGDRRREPARCGCRTAAAPSSPASRCRSSPPRWR